MNRQMHNRIYVFSALLLWSLQAAAGFGFGSECEQGSKESRPTWANRGENYSKPGYKVGIGIAEYDKKEGFEKQKDRAVSSAYNNLVSQIEVTVQADIEQNTTVTGSDAVERTQQSRVQATSKALLRDVEPSHWIDPQDCTRYTLMTVSDESIAKARHEEVQHARLERMKELFNSGIDHETFAVASTRKSYLDEALLVFKQIDFPAIKDAEHEAAIYAKRIPEALVAVEKEIGNTKGRIAVMIQSLDDELPGSVGNRVLEGLRVRDNRYILFPEACDSQRDCIDKAASKGYAMLAWLTLDTETDSTDSGSTVGTLTVTKVVYDTSNGQMINNPSTQTGQVIGWGDKLNWDSAADKAMGQTKP